MSDLKALRHLKKDPVLARLIDQLRPVTPFSNSDIFVDLVDSIVSQQLSTKAAATIFARVEMLVGKITPENILKAADQDLRNCGLSWAKVSYFKDLADRTKSGALQLNELVNMDDESVVKHLTQVKGIGRWSAEMILMFSLNRSDVFPLQDLGIQNALAAQYGLKKTHKSFPKKMAKTAEFWRPYRTLACRYLWKSLDNEPLKK
ncbi:MAG: DNA-3-methyladenine glycosylase [bacterium]|nr:DNA-3-methyladenine glycosylase [bacterium]